MVPSWRSFTAIGLVALAAVAALALRSRAQGLSTGGRVALVAFGLLLGWSVLGLTVPLWFPAQN